MKKTTIFFLLTLNLFIVGCAEPASAKSHKQHRYAKQVKAFDIADTYETSRTDDKYTYGEAYNLCTNLTLNGYSDWRLPTSSEASLAYHKELKYPVRNIFHWTGTIKERQVSLWSNKYYEYYKNSQPWQSIFRRTEKENELHPVRCFRGPIYGGPIAIPKNVKIKTREHEDFMIRHNTQVKKMKERQQNYSSPSSSSSKYRCKFHCVGQWDSYRGGEHNVKTTATTIMDAEEYIKQNYKSTCAQYPFYKGGGGSASVGKMNCSTY